MPRQNGTGVQEGDSVEVTFEGSYRSREHTLSGSVREVTDDGFIFLDESGTSWHEVFDYEHNDETQLVRSADTQSELGSRHGRTRGTFVGVEVQG